MLQWIEESSQKPPQDFDIDDGCSILVLVAHASGAWGSAWYDFQNEVWGGVDDDSPVTHWTIVKLPGQS